MGSRWWDMSHLHSLYRVSVLVHVLAAIVWVGGIGFFSFVLVPWIRSDDAPARRRALHELALRFRPIGWTCFAILLVTGTFNLWVRGVRIESFTRAEWLGSPLGQAVVAKLGLFAAVVALSGLHDFVVGPRVASAMRVGAPPAQVAAARRRASWMGRINGALAIALVAAAVSIVRGCAV